MERVDLPFTTVGAAFASFFGHETTAESCETRRARILASHSTTCGDWVSRCKVSTSHYCDHLPGSQTSPIFLLSHDDLLRGTLLVLHLVAKDISSAYPPKFPRTTQVFPRIKSEWRKRSSHYGARMLFHAPLLPCIQIGRVTYRGTLIVSAILLLRRVALLRVSAIAIEYQLCSTLFTPV